MSQFAKNPETGELTLINKDNSQQPETSIVTTDTSNVSIAPKTGDNGQLAEMLALLTIST